MKLLIGIDLGTTGVRSIVYDESLCELGQEYIEYPLIFLSSIRIEQDAFLWWELVKRSIVSALEKSKNSGDRVVGLGVSSQGIAFLPVDRNFDPMMNAISWLDSRATAEVAEILTRFSERELYEITGKRADAAYVLPKMLWLKKHHSGLFDGASYFLMAHDYIVAKLCGRAMTDHTMASGTMMFDINERRWSQSLIKHFGIDEAKLPRVVAAGSEAGLILPQVAKELGLSADVVISVGGQDQKCAALGAGIASGIATISLGTAAAITRKWDKPMLDERMRIPCFADLLEGKWVTEGVVGTAASSLKWLRQTFFADKSYDDLNEMAVGARTDNLFFYPHLAGSGSPNWYDESAGCYYGIHLNTKAGEMILALFEGIAFQIRHNIEVMQQDESVIRELRLFGGGANSARWCSTIANVTGLTVCVPATAETACAGAAMLAGLGAGVYSTLAQTQNLITIAHRYVPDQEEKTQYDIKYRQYGKIEKKLFENE